MKNLQVKASLHALGGILFRFGEVHAPRAVRVPPAAVALQPLFGLHLIHARRGQ